MRKNIGAADRIIRSLFTSALVLLMVTHAITGRGALFLGWGLAAVLAISVPIVLLFLAIQRLFREGALAGAIK